MVNAQLVSYIKDQLKAGYSTDEIRTYLVGYGYPSRDVEEAVEHAQKPTTKPAVARIVERKTEVPKINFEETKTTEEDFINIFKSWFMTLFMPAGVFIEEKSRASISRGFMNVLTAATLGGLIGGIIFVLKLLIAAPVTRFDGIGFFGLAPITTVQQLTIPPFVAVIAWLIVSALFYVFGLLLGNRGSFERFSYFTSLVAAPLAFILAILSAFLTPCTNFFALVVFGIVGVYPMLYAVKETHEIDLTRAALGTFIPILMFGILLTPALLRFVSLFKTIC